MTKLIPKSMGSTFRYLAGKVGNLTHRLDPVRTSCISLRPDGAATIRGRALIAHVIDGLLLDPNNPIVRSHNHFIEARLMAETFLEQGFEVDFINQLNRWFSPKKHYDVFLCSRMQFERISARMPSDCIKIVNLDTAHWLYNNAAALKRLQEVQNGRGAALSSYAPIEMNRGIEAADYAMLLGNDFDYETYAFARKRIFQVPNPGTIPFPWDEDKDFSLCRKRFLWLGSRGLVHKGLDVVLEAFAQMPDLHLTVCGPVEREPHFVKTFHKELYETPNIHTHGWIDMAGPEFGEVARTTVAHIYPTVADACCGSVVNCMHAGLIPVATREAGLDIDPAFGLLLSAPSAEAVGAAARHIATLPPDRLKGMARRSWEEAQRVYSHENYKRCLGRAIHQIVTQPGHHATPGFVRMESVL